MAQAASLAAAEVSPESGEESPTIPDAAADPDQTQEATGKALTFPEAGRCESQDAESPQDAESEAIVDFLWRHCGDTSTIIYLADRRPPWNDYGVDFQ